MKPRTRQKLLICGMTLGALIGVAGYFAFIFQASQAVNGLHNQHDSSPKQEAVSPDRQDGKFNSVHVSFDVSHGKPVAFVRVGSGAETVGMCVGGVIFTACLGLYIRGPRLQPPPLPGVRGKDGLS